MKNIIFQLSTLLLITLQTACFKQERDSSSSASSSSGRISSTDFSGAISAKNRVSGIQVAWPASKVTPAAYRIYRVSGIKYELLTSLSPDIKSYIDGTVTWGNIYTYVVRAVDTDGVEETNTKKVSALSWGSIAKVEASTRTSMLVTFASTTAVAEEVRVYIEPAKGGGAKVLAATVSGSDLTATITDLKPGFSYKVTAQAFVSSLNGEDGNSLEKTVTTKTYGYHDDIVSSAGWMNISNVRAFGESPAAIPHPIYPDKNPYLDVAELSFRSFNAAGPATLYVVTRTTDGFPLDTSTVEACLPSTVTSCRVRCSSSSVTMTGTGILTCRDASVGPSPARYRYTMSIQNSEGGTTWVEPVPADELDKFSVIVPIPPKNMVLVQRDAVNYEMCFQMASPPDPKNHNRCPYTGIGAIPFNSGPNKAPLNLSLGFYDFGYNLFQDRYLQGCKWTRAADGGHCNANNSPGECIGRDTPTANIGVDGNIYQRLGAADNLACFYRYEGTWIPAASILVTAVIANGPEILQQMYTSDPEVNSGVVGVSRDALDQLDSWTICQGQADPNYGVKRIPRMREYRAFSAFPTVTGDLYGITYTKAWSLYNNNKHNAIDGYGCPNVPPVSSSGISMFPADVAEVLSSAEGIFSIYSSSAYSGRSFRINARANADCLSRYGAYDNLGVSRIWASDLFDMDLTNNRARGRASILDIGNKDTLTDINGGTAGYLIDYNSGTNNFDYKDLSLSSNAVVKYMSLPLGLPVMLSSSSVYLPVTAFDENYSGVFKAPMAAVGSPTVPRGSIVSRRWNSLLYAFTDNASDMSVRCVMSAD